MNVLHRNNPIRSILKHLVLVGFAFATASSYAAPGITFTSENVNGSPHAGPLIQATPGDLLETALSSISQNTPADSRHVAASVYDGQIVTDMVNFVLPSTQAGYWGSATPGASYVVFNLNTNTAPLGYTISSLKVIQNGDTARPGQNWKVSFKPVGSDTFTAFYTLSPTGTASKVNQVILADTTAAPLTSSVAALRFDFGPTKPGLDWTWYREIDVIGTVTGDSTPPAITTLSPADNATEVTTTANLVVAFNELIAIGTGNIVLTNLTDATSTTIAITDTTQVSVLGSRLTINPTANLTGAKNYAILIDSGAIKDLANNAFSGIADDTIWNFAADSIPPSVVTLSPSDNATDVNAAMNLVVTFNESIAIGTGNITLKNLTDATQSTIAISDSSQVSVAGAVLTIDPTATLSAGKSYAVQIATTAIKDLSGNAFPGITNDTTWNFVSSGIAVTLTSETATPFDTGAAHTGPLIQATTSDLLQTSLLSFTNSAPTGNNYNVPSVFDGQIVTGWSRPAGYWGSATPGASYVEFNLTTATAQWGYDISSIKVIQWGDGARPKQAWKVSFKLVGSSTFTAFYTLPLTGVASKVNQVVLADVTTVPLGRNVAAVRFDFGDSGAGNGWTWYHEIDVIGKPTPPVGTRIILY